MRAALHTQNNSALLSRGPCGRIVHGERQAATAKSLPRVMLLQSAAEAGPDWLNLPFGRGPRDTVLMQGSPARAGCNKGEDRTAVCGSLTVGLLSLGCRRHHGRREGGRNVVQGLRLRCLHRCCGHKRLSLWRSPGATERWGPSRSPSGARLRDSVRAATAVGE